jgi:hypothetical protein
VACLAVPNLSTLSHKRHDFPKTFIEQKMGVLIFSTNVFATFRIVRRNRDRLSQMYRVLHGKYPLFFSDFNET